MCIRDRQNVIERSVILCDTENFSVDESWLSPEPKSGRVLAHEMIAQEKEFIELALAECKGRVSGASGAAVRLGMPPSTLESKIRSMNINKYRFKTSSSIALPSRTQQSFSRTSRIHEEAATL